MTEKPLEQMGLRDLRAIAREQMPAEAWHHFNGGGETKATFYRNPRSFQKYLFRQRIFHDVTDPDISVELFGHQIPIPAITTPVGSFSLMGKDAERQVAEGAGRVGAMMFVSQAAKLNPQGWRDATQSPLVLMAYMNRGRGEVSQYAKLSQDLGFAAVGITATVILDSGVRSGGDIVKALALGAKAVLTGRPVAWGVSAFGPRGVERVFAILSEEMKRVLCMTGVASVARITSAIIIRDG